MVTATDVEYRVEDTAMVGRLALPDGSDTRPAVLIAHEGPGLDDYQRGRAEQLAELGFVAFALDYPGGGRWFEDRDEMLARLRAPGADPDRTRAPCRAGPEQLPAAP